MDTYERYIYRNFLYSLRHILRFRISKVDTISKITEEPAEIMSEMVIEQIKPGYKAYLVVCQEIHFHYQVIPY